MEKFKKTVRVIFITMAVIGLFDMAIQGATSGEVGVIKNVLSVIFQKD